MLHLLNKSAFIILLETVDSLRVFFVFVSIYICILVQVFIAQEVLKIRAHRLYFVCSLLYL